MKTTIATLFALLALSAVAQAQFRGSEPVRPNAADGVVQESSPMPILGFIDMNKFSMNHSISMSYNSFGGESLGLTKYTNTIRYQLAAPLSVRADISMQYSPFNSLPAAFQNDFNKIYLERAQIDYRPTDDMRISLQYRNLSGYYNPYYHGYGPGYYGSGIGPIGPGSSMMMMLTDEDER